MTDERETTSERLGEKVKRAEVPSVTLERITGVELRSYSEENIQAAATRLQELLRADVTRQHGATWEEMNKLEGIVARAAEAQIGDMERYVAAHVTDFERVMGLLNDASLAERFWKRVQQVRGMLDGPNVDVEKASARDFANWWNEDPAEFYFNVRLREAVRETNKDDPLAQWQRVDADLQLLWSYKQHAALRYPPPP